MKIGNQIWTVENLRTTKYIDTNNEQLVGSTGFAVIRPYKKECSKYFSYLMTCEKIIDTICASSVGVSYPAVTASVIGNIPNSTRSIENEEKKQKYKTHYNKEAARC